MLRIVRDCTPLPGPYCFWCCVHKRAYRGSPSHVPATRTDAITSTMLVMWVTSEFLATYSKVLETAIGMSFNKSKVYF